MKKSYLMIAAAAALLTACAGNDTFHEIEVQESPITFNQALNKTTRAYIADEAGLANAGGFGVYGYKKKNSDSDWTSQQTIFDNTNVNSSDQGTTWAYSNLRFWDKAAHYNFYAIAPYKASGYTIAPSTGMFTINSVASALYSSSDDYMIDRDGNTNVDGSYTSSHEKVNLEFHHIMAKVDFKLKSTLAQSSNTQQPAKIVVRRLVMTGWNSGNGKFIQSSNATPTTLTKDEWTIETRGAGSVTILDGANDNDDITITCGGTDIKDVPNWYIMVPQIIAEAVQAPSEVTPLRFEIDYTYYHDENETPTDDLGDDYTEVFDNQVATYSTQHIWGTDSHTTYTLDIKPAAIEFDVTNICGFHVIQNSDTNPIDVQ